LEVEEKMAGKKPRKALEWGKDVLENFSTGGIRRKRSREVTPQRKTQRGLSPQRTRKGIARRIRKREKFWEGKFQKKAVLQTWKNALKTQDPRNF